jgi:hypothetical protein
LARRSCSHEITSLHFRAAAFPRHLGLLRHPFSHSVTDAKTSAASQAHRPCEADAKAVAHSFGQTHRRPVETKIFPLSRRLFLSLFRFLSLSLSLSFPKVFF